MDLRLPRQDRARPLRFLRAGDGAPLPIPDGALRWVVVDRSHGITWGHPGFTDFGHFFDFVGKGQPSEDELRTERALASDARFHRVFWNARRNQAVFQRVGP